MFYETEIICRNAGQSAQWISFKKIQKKNKIRKKENWNIRKKTC